MENVTTFASVLSQVDMSAISNNILGVIAAVAVPVIGIIAIKKGWSFLKGQIKRA